MTRSACVLLIILLGLNSWENRTALAINWDGGGDEVDEPVNTTPDSNWTTAVNWNADRVPGDEEEPENVFINFGPEIIVDSEVPPVINVFLACRYDGNVRQGKRSGPCEGENNILSVESGGVMNLTERMRVGAFGLETSTLNLTGNGAVYAMDGLHTNPRNDLPDVTTGKQTTVVNMSGDAFFYAGTGIAFGPDESTLNFSGNAQMIAPDGLFTQHDAFPREELLDLDYPRSDESDFFDVDFFYPAINLSGNATLAFRADVVDDLLADIYISSGLIVGEGIAHKLVADGIELLELDDENMLGPVENVDARVFYIDAPATACDVNADGVCDTLDIDVMSQNVLDGLNTSEDRQTLIESPADDGFNTYVGDSNLDGVFNDQDFVSVFIAGKYVTGKTAGWAEGDWDGNLTFNEQDFVAAFIAGGYLQAPRGAVSAVPEPASWVLLSFGLLLGLRRWR